ncbi:MAG: HlyC/CorC family transporter [Anaerolineales bacterium]|nr:MAG: HlyC/CorC family transporter [Anaerolineales bacterium]
MDSINILDILRLVALVLLVLANGFFVAAEFSLVSVRRTRIAELVAGGNPRARWVQKAIDDPDRFIAATQLGITLASLGLGWIAEPALGKFLEPLINLFPTEIEAGVAHSLSAGFSFAIITFLHVVVGELAPKSVALQSPENTSLFVAQPTIWTERLFTPFIWVLNGTGNALLRWLGVVPAAGHELVHSVAELKMLVRASAQGGVMGDEAEEMLTAVFDFGELLVRQVMVPRTEMIAVHADARIEDIFELAINNSFTKFPVYTENQDQILGVVNLKDLLVGIKGIQSAHQTARDLMREAIFIPETARVITLLQLFRARQRHMAIVLDEYGGTAGVVTLADLLEEIVGEVSDPFDTERDIQPLPDGSSLVDGLTLIEEVNDHFGLKLVDPYYDTIAGYFLGRLERLAQVGDALQTDGIRLRVEAMDGLRIARISITRETASEVHDHPPTKHEA